MSAGNVSSKKVFEISCLYILLKIYGTILFIASLISPRTAKKATTRNTRDKIGERRMRSVNCNGEIGGSGRCAKKKYAFSFHDVGSGRDNARYNAKMWLLVRAWCCKSWSNCSCCALVGENAGVGDGTLFIASKQWQEWIRLYHKTIGVANFSA